MLVAGCPATVTTVSSPLLQMGSLENQRIACSAYVESVSRQDNSHGSALISFGERNACDSSFLSVQPWLQSKRCAARWTSECRVFWRLFCHPSRVYVADFFFKLERIQVCIQCSRQTSTCAIRHKIEMRVRFRTIFDLVSLL